MSAPNFTPTRPIVDKISLKTTNVNPIRDAGKREVRVSPESVGFHPLGTVNICPKLQAIHPFFVVELLQSPYHIINKKRWINRQTDSKVQRQ